ncbi:phytanoyl-CoA dioxygenase family protein [Leifsonia sp. ZF2019]|nr:phytanoyl-CoA dioxygenase family protein [Leifsonia sp. ZF2019]
MGYLVIRQAVSPELVALLKSRIAEVHQARTEASREHVRKLYRIYDEAPELFEKVFESPKLREELINILGPNVVYVKNRHNQAALNTGDQTNVESRLHRDILYPTRGVVTAALYLDESTVENGATVVIPGSHRLPFVGVTQIDPPGGGTWMDEHGEYAGLSAQALAVPMRAGDILLFDGLLFHTVGANQTEDPRTSVIMGFRSADELDANPDTERQKLIAGEFLYRGNN